MNHWFKYILLYLIFQQYAWSADSIKIALKAFYGNKKCETVQQILDSPTSIFKANNTDFLHLCAAIVFKSNSDQIAPETYFFKWVFSDGSKRTTIDSYEDNDILIHKRIPYAIDDQYGFTKTIYDVKKGEYELEVYKKEKGNMKLVGQESVKGE